mmetsp:Transcript_90878/g.261879  ORF Transcript_90878/g.261879 Transcript_90878/m.261879 type:complete len:223 (-) Transcript_90878:277-945(-)
MAIFGIAKCCCADGATDNQLSYAQGGGDDAVVPAMVGVNALPAVSVSKTGSSDSEAAPAATPSPAASGQQPSDREAEKARLQKLVNSFVKNALKGYKCFYVDEASGDKKAAVYRIPKTLETLTITGSEDGAPTLFNCRIAEVQDVYCLAEDGETCFDPKVIKAATQADRELLLLLILKNGTRLCMMEETTTSRDTFLECLRILCIYAQAAASQSKRGLSNAS